jgi:hypothetical protein
MGEGVLYGFAHNPLNIGYDRLFQMFKGLSGGMVNQKKFVDLYFPCQIFCHELQPCQ